MGEQEEAMTAPSPEAQRVAREICAIFTSCRCHGESEHGPAVEGCRCNWIAARLAPLIERAEAAEDERDNLREQIDSTRLSADGTATRLRSERDELRARRDAAVAALRNLLREEAIRDDGHFALERAREVARAVLADAREKGAS